MRKLIGPVLAVLLVVEIVAAIGIVAAQPDGFESILGTFGPERRQDLPTQTFETVTGAILNVDNTNGKVEIVGVSGINQVTVKATKVIHGSSDKGFELLTFEAKQNGNDVTINAQKGDGWSGLLSNRWIDIQVTVPAYMIAKVENSNGEINLSNLDNPTAQHLIQNGNGAIRISQVKAGRLDVKNSNGIINLQSITATLNSSNDNGSIKAFDSTLNLGQIKNGNGEVEINGRLQQTTNGSIETGNSSVKLRLEQIGDVRFDISTGNGSIEYNKGGSFQSRNDHHLVTNGTGPTIRVNTGNGSVKVE